MSKDNKLKFFRKETKSYSELKEINKNRRLKFESDSADNLDEIGKRVSLKYLDNFNKNFGKEKMKKVIDRLQGRKKTVDMGTKFINDIYDLDKKKEK